MRQRQATHNWRRDVSKPRRIVVSRFRFDYYWDEKLCDFRDAILSFPRTAFEQFTLANSSFFRIFIFFVANAIRPGGGGGCLRGGDRDAHQRMTRFTQNLFRWVVWWVQGQPQAAAAASTSMGWLPISVLLALDIAIVLSIDFARRPQKPTTNKQDADIQCQ